MGWKLARSLSLVFIVVSGLVAGAVLSTISCSGPMPWCKHAPEWTARLNQAEELVADARGAAEVAFAEGLISQKQLDEVLASCLAADATISLARAAIALCVRDIGSSANAENNLERAEKDAKVADGLLSTFRSAAPRKPLAKEK